MQKKNFSLIVATVNREKEILSFLESIRKSKISLDKIEVIIVDQNETIDLTTIIDKYNSSFQIIHIKSSEKGVSRNRNIGIRLATGDIIGFPDDDCEYLENTLNIVFETFNKFSDLDAVIGRIIDETGQDCIRKWSRRHEKVTTRNFYSKMSAITIFKKNKKEIFFDEEFGPGSKYGSSEDTDLLYQIIKKGNNVVYNPDVILFHPKGTTNFDKKKAYFYGVGHGAFIRKHLNLNLLNIFIQGIILVLLRIIKALIFRRADEVDIWINSFRGRITGIIKER